MAEAGSLERSHLGLPTILRKAGRPVSRAQIMRPAMRVRGTLTVPLLGKPVLVLLKITITFLFCAFETISHPKFRSTRLHVPVLSNISSGGLNDIKRHVGIPEHLRGKRAQKNTQNLQQFLKRDVLTTVEEKVIAAELTKVYYGVNHNMSYNSIDCDSKLSSVIFNDSQIASKISLGCSAHMVHNVIRYAMEKCEFDVENLVLKVYGHLSYHVKKV
ncbi:hypothetical protein QTP88_021601 [Uroleucon formosanum]